MRLVVLAHMAELSQPPCHLRSRRGAAHHLVQFHAIGPKPAGARPHIVSVRRKHPRVICPIAPAKPRQVIINPAISHKNLPQIIARNLLRNTRRAVSPRLAFQRGVLVIHVRQRPHAPIGSRQPLRQILTSVVVVILRLNHEVLLAEGVKPVRHRQPVPQ